jgi:hypothetical protein
MPKIFDREVLSNKNRTKEEVDKAIDLLQKDVDYAIKSLRWNLAAEIQPSIRESFKLLDQLKDLRRSYESTMKPRSQN